jgi:hypothetical protein
LLNGQRFFLRQNVQAAFFEDFAGLDRIFDFNDQNGAVVGRKTRGVEEVDIMGGQALSGISTATTSVNVAAKPAAFRSRQAVSGSLTSTFMTPQLPVLATMMQRMLMLACERTSVMRATWPGLFSANIATSFTVFIALMMRVTGTACQ